MRVPGRFVLLVAIASSVALATAACARGEDIWDVTRPDTSPDTAWDTLSDPIPDSTWDPILDTGIDTGIDTGWDSGIDTPVDSYVDPGVDEAPSCTESPCCLVPNAGCPPGQKCSLGGITRICTAAGTGTKGASCTADSGCAAGFICLGLQTTEGSAERACYPFCLTETQCPGDSSVCWAAFSGSTDKVCTLGCNLVTNTGCPSGSKCNLYQLPTVTEDFITDCCADSGYGGMGTSCTLESECGAGTYCNSSVYECIGYCTITPSDSCSWGCSQFTDAYGSPLSLFFDGSSYGYCYY